MGSPQPDLIARGLGALPSMLGDSHQPRYRVFIRDGTYRRVDELSDWISLELVLRFNDVGSWALTLSADSLSAPLIEKGGGIFVTREVEGVEKIIFSGFVWTEWGYTETEFRAAGYADEALLWTPARPTPTQAEPPFSDAAYVLTDQASAVMRALVALNIGPNAPAPWGIAALNPAPDPQLGATVTARANLQPLLTLLAELAITPYAGGLGFYLRQSDVVSGQIEFGIYAPPDRSADAKFGIDLGTVSNYEDIESAPEANHVYVMGGDGFGTNRTIIAEQDDASIGEWGRVISTVIDRRGTTDLAELNQQAAEAIAGVSTLRRTRVVPFEVPSLQFGIDYDLGTLVTVVTRAGEVVDLIREVEIDLDPEQGATVRPIVGQGDGGDADERMATITRTIQNRLSNLERNWNVPPNSIDNSMIYQTERWSVGDLKPTTRSTEQAGWKLCNGQTVSRATYAALFAVIGTTYGAGDGSTTFGLPDLRNRFPVGAGGAYGLGSIGGAASQDVELTVPSHSHPHSHGGGTLAYSHVHTSQPHTHPGSHSHGIGAHTHNVDIDHDHAPFDSGGANTDTVAVGRDEPGGGAEDHHHSINVPALGTTSRMTSAGSGSTESDSNAHAASYSGSPAGPSSASWTGGTESDSNAAASVPLSTSVSTVPPYVAVNYLIYAGV